MNNTLKIGLSMFLLEVVSLAVFVGALIFSSIDWTIPVICGSVFIGYNILALIFIIYGGLSTKPKQRCCEY